MNRRQYYWIVTNDPDTGKPYLIYGGETEQEARNKGLEQLCGVDFELKQYPTRNQDEASAFLRGKRLSDTHSLGEAGRRIGHERSINRLRKSHLR